jgi:hypothetical protein
MILVGTSLPLRGEQIMQGMQQTFLKSLTIALLIPFFPYSHPAFLSYSASLIADKHAQGRVGLPKIAMIRISLAPSLTHTLMEVSGCFSMDLL